MTVRTAAADPAAHPPLDPSGSSACHRSSRWRRAPSTAWRWPSTARCGCGARGLRRRQRCGRPLDRRTGPARPWHPHSAAIASRLRPHRRHITGVTDPTCNFLGLVMSSTPGAGTPVWRGSAV